MTVCIVDDTNRVTFSVDPTDEQSTGYINASYVTGYKETRSFIAAQGPKKNTVVDFWRMVWDNEVYKIVMLARTTEGGKLKCEQYWPDQLGAVTYGQTTVNLLHSQIFTDYTIRQLKIQKDEDTRLIRQYHFLTWPDHGVPDYGAALMSLRKKVISHVHPAEGPTVVHCSTGVCRTGTYIALDYLMEQLKAEGVVDIFTCVQSLRAQRMFMVQTLEQYVFIYDTILETHTCGDSLIRCSNFEKMFHRLSTPNAQTGKTRLEQQYELLTLTTHPVQQSACKGALRPENTEKNRDPVIIPADRHRPFLTITRITDRSDYINAVFVSGYRQKNSFLATQHPLPDTVLDFWRMIYDFKCPTIVMLNDFKEEDDDYCMYWPDQGILELGPLKIELILCSEASDMVTRTLKLSKVSKDGEVMESTVVKQFQLTCWPDEDPLPSNPDDIVSLFSGVQQWQQSSGDGIVTVHCKDGASRSGLLCVSYYMLEKMKVEQEVDVFHTTKRLRVSRPQFITSQEQFNFCYEVARSYINTLETYANCK